MVNEPENQIDNLTLRRLQESTATPVNYSATELPEHLKSGGIPPFFRVRP